jgi:molybdopterin synthase sulfur carrier subunit
MPPTSDIEASPMNQQITILYFGHLAEMLYRESEIMFLPLTVKTISDLMAHLARRGDNWPTVFEKPRETMRITVNKAFADPGTPIKGGDEIAFVAFSMV